MDSVLHRFITNLPVDGWQRFMVDALWQSAIIGAFALLVCRYLVRQPSAKAWILALALTACFLVPSLSYLTKFADLTLPIRMDFVEFAISEISPPSQTETLVLSRRSRSQTLAGPNRNEDNSEKNSQPSPIDSYSADLPIAKKSFRLDAVNDFSFDTLLNVIGLVWAVCSSFLLLRLVASALAVRRLMLCGDPCKDAGMLEAVSNVSRKVGVGSSPRLVMSDQIAAPMVLAYFRPVILIPRGNAIFQQRNLFETTLAHEIAHVRRCDGWTRLLAQVVLIALPLQPLAWWMRRSFFRACEEACDDWAVATGSDPADLAAILAESTKCSRDQRKLLLATGMSGTRSRIMRLLSMNELPVAKLSFQWQAIVTFVTIIVGIGLGIVQLTNESKNEPVNQRQLDSAIQQVENRSESNIESEITVQPANAIVGVCVDEDDKPIAEARVRLFLYGQDKRDPSKIVQTELRSTISNQKGQFEFEGIRPTGNGTWRNWVVIGQSRGRATCSSYITPDTKIYQPLKLLMRPSGKLKGRVTDEDGNPVADALVSAGSPLVNPVYGIRASVSDADGNYELTDLTPFKLADAKPVSACFGQIQHPKYSRNVFKYSQIPGVANITLRRPAIVEGQVNLKGSALPAIGAAIEFWSDTIPPDSWTRATADSNGRFQIEGLPPGKYRATVTLKGRPNMFIEHVELSAGLNREDFSMELGGILKGQLINALTEEPIQLEEGELMQISESKVSGIAYSGMPSANINPDGSFSLRLPAGRRFFGLYMGTKWQGVNTDRLGKDGVEIVDGETAEIEVRLKPREEKKQLVALTEKAATDLAEQIAIDAIKKLGGWVELETIDGSEHVVEVNMVYHNDEKTGRSENRIICDECLSYVPKFPKLKRLFLYREQATDSGLASLRGMEDLEEIGIWDASEVSDMGAAHIAQINSLREIHIQNAKLSDEALKHFGRLQKVEKLSLQGNHFTNLGLKHLRNSKQLKVLWLGLGKCEITDEGLESVSDLTKLELLDLQGSKVTDKGLQYLCPLKNLKSLWVGGSPVTNDGLKRLSKALPDLKGLR